MAAGEWITHFDHLPEREILPGLRARMTHSQHMTFIWWNIDKGADLPGHSHPHEQVVNMLEGRFELTINDETRVLHPGSVAVIPPHATHSGKALTHCRILDVFSPVREDYRL